MKYNIHQVLINKMLERENQYRSEFTQLRYDDKDFAYLYNENEFHQWCKDYNIY